MADVAHTADRLAVGAASAPRSSVGRDGSARTRRGVNIEQATLDASRGNLLPVYLLGGAEVLLVSRCVEAIRKSTVGLGPRGLSEDLFDGRSTQAHMVIEACRTLPMMSRRRLVVVRNVEAMASKQQEELIGYFDHTVGTAVLLLLAIELDNRKKLCLEAKKQGFLFVAEHPREGDLGPWIERECKARGVAMDPGAVDSLSLAIGPDLSLLSDAIDRLSLYAHGRAVTVRDVDDVITPVREIPAFDLADAVLERNRRQSVTVLARLTSQGIEALPALGLLARQVHMVARARAAIELKTPGSMAQILRVHPQSAEKFASAARKWTTPQIHRALRILATVDMALKGSQRDDERILEECVLALCGAAGLGESALR